MGLSGKTAYQEKITTGATTVTSNGKTDLKFSGDNAAANTTYLGRFDFGGTSWQAMLQEPASPLILVTLLASAISPETLVD
ncbi:MAG: hypothetical protein H7258_10120 [Ferruginibacter sp.]|nr:hypothetical protein [Ferruginibacter sp.]